MLPLVSTGLPVRDEAAGIQAPMTAAAEYLGELAPPFEQNVSDSGSTAGTGLRALSAGLPHVRVVRVDPPGMGRLLGRAMRHSRGPVIGFTFLK